MRRHLLLALLVVSGGLAASAPPSRNAVSGDVPSRLDALLTGLHERGLFDGAVVVGNPDAIVWQKGFGNANHERAVAFRPETPADGASLAKTFTAALVLMLQQEGKLDIDDPATRLLPDLPYADVTLRHLLSHSSGLPVPDYGVFDTLIPAGEVRTTERLIAALASARLPLAFQPGSRFEYNSFGFDLAALATSRAAGKPLSSLLAERLFKPTGMSSPFLRPGRLSDFPGVRTRGYRRVDGTVQANEVFDLEAFHGGSNIYISAADLHRWNVSFLAAPLLDETALRGALTPARIGAAESGLTLGSWYRNDKGTTFWYSGHLQGFHSEVFRDTASRRSIVYVSNNTLEPWLQRGLIRAIAAIQDGREPAPQRAATRRGHSQGRLSTTGRALDAAESRRGRNRIRQWNPVDAQPWRELPDGADEAGLLLCPRVGLRDCVCKDARRCVQENVCGVEPRGELGRPIPTRTVARASARPGRRARRE